MEDGADPSPAHGEGFADLYRQHDRPLLGMALALLGSRGRAEEVVQQAFANTFDRYHRLPDPLAATRASVLRGCGAQKTSPDDPTRPTERILQRVRSLPRAQRDAVALRHSLGLEVAEIDHTLGVQAGTAAMRLHEAGAQLRASLEVGEDLEHALTTAFADTTVGLGTVLARPGEAQRRVYRRRRIRVAVGTAAGVAIVVLGAIVLSRGPADQGLSADSGGTEAPATAAPVSTDGSEVSGPATTVGTSTTSLPATSTTTTAPPEGTYTVVANDGWYAIAAKLNVPVDSLLQANGATLQTTLLVGQVLKVPPKATT
ncbi:MAG TPA: LysM peptidoglycan-binding domain-containing protein [Acidimicrobiales bacterium]